jgi:hypothetical protein
MPVVSTDLLVIERSGILYRGSVADMRNFILANAAVSNPEYISGFRISAVGTTITISPGQAYIEGALSSIRRSTVTTISGGVSANTNYHLYLNEGSGTVTRSTTGPAAPYYGTARSMAGNNQERYLGSVRSNASSQYIPQTADAGHNQVHVSFLHNVGTDSRLVSSGTPLSATDVSFANFAPITANYGRFRFQNNGTTGLVRPYIWNGSSFVIYTNTTGNPAYVLEVMCDATPKIRYDVTGDGVAFIDLLGYGYTR